MSDPADGNGRGEMSAQERSAFERRLSELDKRLHDAEAQRPGATQRRDDSKGMNVGMRIATELVAGILVGGVIGWALDRWLGTSPWLFLLFFFLGVGAGFLNTIRAAGSLAKTVDPSAPPPAVKDDEDD